MFPRASRTSAIALTLIGLAGAPVAAQTGPAEPVVATGEGQTDAYLGERALDGVLAARLRDRLRRAQGAERIVAAEALGKVYGRLLTRVRTAEQRQAVEERCRELIESVPEVESYELRIELAHNVYLTIENNAESKRLLLTTNEQDAESIRVLRSVAPQFEALARKLNTETEKWSRRLDSPGNADPDELRAKLETARGLRSRAAYYAGWSLYYLAFLEGDQKNAAKAMESFGIILGAVPGHAASVERITKNFLRFPHYARSAIGCALCASMLGRDVEAQRWLDAVEGAEELAPEVSEQLFRRRITILAESKRWNDINAVVHAYREREESSTKRLTKGEARLLAVLALDASAAPGAMPRTRQVAEELAQTALADLVALGEVSHVNDLFRRFGTAPIADTGFIASYLRSLDAYEKAKAAHTASGADTKEPTNDPETIARFREAATLLAQAIDSPDSARFPDELSRAMVRRGLALFFAGDFEPAADQLEKASASCSKLEDRREALWFAIVSLDHAVQEGRVSLRPRCDNLAALLVKQYPGSERAVALLSRLVKSSLISGDDAVKSLLDIPPESPLYLTARSEAVSYLYAKFSTSRGADRDFIALRVAEIGEEVVKLYHALAISGTDESARDAAERLSVRARQVADVVLQMTSPDPARAEAMLALIESTASHHGVILDGLAPELNYYRFQCALARADEGGADRAYNAILASTPTAPTAHKFIAACDTIRFNRAVERFRASPDDIVSAKRVVQFGQAIINRAGEGAPDQAAGVMNRTADAALAVWRADGSAEMRDLVISLDELLLRKTRTAASIRRLALVIESTGKKSEALELWNEILAGVDDTSDPWFEARCESLRILIDTNPAEAVAAMQQHRVLHPDLGPERWRPQLEELDRKIKALPPPPTSPTPAPPAKKGGG